MKKRDKNTKISVGDSVLILDSAKQIIESNCWNTDMFELIGDVFIVSEIVSNIEIYFEESSFFFPASVLKKNGKRKRRTIFETIVIAKTEFPIKNTYQTEQLPQVSSYLQKYFNGTIACHHHFNKVDKNSIYFNCTFISSAFRNVNVREKVKINFDPSIVKTSSCWDGNISLNYSHTYKQNVIEFYTSNNRKLGFYFYNLKSLVLCDLTHHSSGITIVKKIVNYLIKNNLVREFKRIKKDNDKVKITIGADPEFELFKDGSFICAGDLFSGCGPEYKVGLDGNNDVIELRPSPAKAGDVKGFIDEMTNLMTTVHKTIFNSNKGNITVSAKGNRAAIGGHWHIGVNNKVYQPSSKLVKLLDYFLGTPFWSTNGTARGSYKRIAWTRDQDWGFEYRSTPAACFADPIITGICAKILGNIIKKYFNKNKFRIYKKQKVSDKQLQMYGKLTTDEIVYFRNFIKNFNNVSQDENILAAWLKDIPKFKIKPISVDFSDEWANNKKTLILKRIAKMIGETEFSKTIRLHLYGLSQDRGNVVSGISHCSLQDINHSYTKDMKVSIGLPKFFRGSRISAISITSLLNELVNEIKKRMAPYEIKNDNENFSETINRISNLGWSV